MLAAGSCRRLSADRPVSFAARSTVRSRAGSSAFSGTTASRTVSGAPVLTAREVSPRASSVPCEWWGASASAVLASVRCMGP